MPQLFVGGKGWGFVGHNSSRPAPIHAIPCRKVRIGFTVQGSPAGHTTRRSGVCIRGIRGTTRIWPSPGLSRRRLSRCAAMMPSAAVALSLGWESPATGPGSQRRQYIRLSWRRGRQWNQSILGSANWGFWGGWRRRLRRGWRRSDVDRKFDLDYRAGGHHSEWRASYTIRKLVQHQSPRTTRESSPKWSAPATIPDSPLGRTVNQTCMGYRRV
jgi:hypothetical protein